MTAANSLRRTATKPCAVADLLQGLQQVWLDCWDDAPGGEVARALACNLVVVARAEAEPACRANLSRVTARTPARVFLLLLGQEPGMRAEVAAATREHNRIRDIVLEEVVVHLPSQRLASVPGIVRPLLISDLPNHLFWCLPWPQDAVFARKLRELCEHIIVDSDQAAAPPSTVPGRTTDLSWLRLRPWRRALAEAFERAPHAAHAPHRALLRWPHAQLGNARLLANWLAQRLQAQIEFETADDPTQQRLLLLAGDIEIVIERKALELEISVSTAQRCFLPFAQPASRGSDGDLLAAAVDG